jgi:mevalonate kinase
MKTYSGQACAKIIIAGEHAVVYGKPALIAPINLSVKCTISANNSNSINIFNKQDDSKYLLAVDDLINHNDEEISKFDQSIKLICLSLMTTYKTLDINKLEGFDLIIDSSIPIGGFGSSTSLATALVISFCKYIQISVEKNDILNIVMNIEENFSNYRPAGADQTAIVYNKFIFFQKLKPQNLIKEITIQNSKILEKCLVIQSGKPETKTGDVVLFIKSKYDANKIPFENIFDKIGDLTIEIEKNLVEDDSYNFKYNIDRLNEELIKLGIVTEKTIKLINSIKSIGGNYVKVSGAGSIGNGYSGALLCYCDEIEKTQNFLNNMNIEFFKPW